MKKPFLLPILALTVFLSTCSQSPKRDTKEKLTVLDSPPKTAETDSTRYIPQPTGWVNDYVHLFSKTEADSLESLIDAYEKKTSVELSVATIDSSMMGPIDFEPYTLLMFRTWGVGKVEKNNGILIVIARDLRRIRIQNGYGIEKVLTDGETKIIMDENITPYFKEGKFYQGTREGILAIINKLEKNGL